MGKNYFKDGKIIALFVMLLAIFIEELIDDPDKTGVVGDWFAVLGDTLSSLADTQLLFNQKKEDKKNIIKKQIEVLQNQLNEL